MKMLCPLGLKNRLPRSPCLSPPPCPPVLSPRSPDTSGFKKTIVRKCPVLHFYPTFPEPIRGNPKLRAETCASGLAGVENPNGDTGLNGPVKHPSQTITLRYAKLRQVTVGYARLRAKILQTYRNTSTLPTEPGRCMGVLPGCAPNTPFTDGVGLIHRN